MNTLFKGAKGRVIAPDSRDEMLRLAVGGDKPVLNIYYDKVHEASVTRCKNGIAVNFPEEYMRVREPENMVIADNLPTDKPAHIEKYGIPFDGTRNAALEWLRNQDELICMPFYSGNGGLTAAYESLLVVPANAAFYALLIADLQGFIPAPSVPESFKPRIIIYIAPPFRHSHYGGKQAVVHNRSESAHEIFSFSLYPGHGKMGIFTALLNIGEQERWATLHAAAVKVVTPYEISTVIMHEGASGGGKSEMLEAPARQADGKILLAKHRKTGELISFNLSDSCTYHPVTDDMAVCPPELQNNSGKLVCADGEEGWFLQTNHITAYGTAPEIEKAALHPPGPLVFINTEAVADSTILPWEHSCSNPRLVMPRNFYKNAVCEAVEVDVRSFGLRQPPASRKSPSYGILGLFHVLPPALAWLWRIVAPCGFSGVKGDNVPVSGGIGSYLAFLSGKRVSQANLLLEQILHTLRTKYVIIPNQYIGNYEVGFSAERLVRDYLAKRGGAKFAPEALEPSRCPLLGYSPASVKIDGSPVPEVLIHTHTQRDVGKKAYDAGAAVLTDFFKKEARQYLVPELSPLGRRIIEACLADSSAEVYSAIIPVPN